VKSVTVLLSEHRAAVYVDNKFAREDSNLRFSATLCEFLEGQGIHYVEHYRMCERWLLRLKDGPLPAELARVKVDLSRRDQVRIALARAERR